MKLNRLQIIDVLFFFEHANLKSPKWLNAAFGLIFVIPNHHRVLH